MFIKWYWRLKFYVRPIFFILLKIELNDLLIKKTLNLYY